MASDLRFPTGIQALQPIFADRFQHVKAWHIAYLLALVQQAPCTDTSTWVRARAAISLAVCRRYAEAIEISLRYLSEVSPSDLACPTAVQLCYLAGDFDRLRKLSRERGDLLNYVAQALAPRS